MSEIKNDYEGRKKYDFTHKSVDVRDEEMITNEMLRDGWSFYSKDYNQVLNANAAVLLIFYRAKKAQNC
ncbi:hypothetical protein EPO14_03900 [Patescibacteria group bacterium]|nr:MAG: hypothetical protein EPO14_03900 [Patescibacteria group bacterium]